jgi:hypothetical protein
MRFPSFYRLWFRPSVGRALASVILAGGGIYFLSGPVSASPLDKGACAKLAQDIQNMKTLDVDKLMEKGPNWAVSHLSSGDLALVRQYIDLDEQMKFRCSAPSSLVHLKHLEDEDEEAGGKAPGETADEADKTKEEARQADSAPPSQLKEKPAKAPKKTRQPAEPSSGDGR